MNIYKISEDIDLYYKKMSHKAKVWSLVGVALLILLLLISLAMVFYFRYQRDEAVANYEKVLEKSNQNYYLQSIANSNLEKKLQDLSLELAKLRNNTVELERMFWELREDNANLADIRKRLEDGIRRTKSQLDHMENSVNTIINQRIKVIKNTEEDLQYSKYPHCEE